MARNNFQRFASFRTQSFLVAFCTVGYGVCIIHSSDSFQYFFLKLCRYIVDILKMFMWFLMELKLISTEYGI